MKSRGAGGEGEEEDEHAKEDKEHMDDDLSKAHQDEIKKNMEAGRAIAEAEAERKRDWDRKKQARWDPSGDIEETHHVHHDKRFNESLEQEVLSEMAR